jgi:hypothetical protein
MNFEDYQGRFEEILAAYVQTFQEHSPEERQTLSDYIT